MRFLSVVAMLSVGCFSKPDQFIAGDGGTADGAPIGPCDWSPTDLRVYLPFDEPTGLLASDRSGASHNGTLRGGAGRAAGRVGGAVSFAGDHWVDIGSVLALDNLSPISACAWIYFDVLPASDRLAATIVDKSSNGFNGGWNMYVEESTGYRVGFLTNRRWHVTGSLPVSPMEWTHVCATWDGLAGADGIKLYRNGAVEPVQDARMVLDTSNESDAAEPLVLGRQSNGNNYNLAGKIDEFFLYERVLTLSEIQLLHRCAQ